MFIFLSSHCTVTVVRIKPWKRLNLECVLSTQTKGICPSNTKASNRRWQQNITHNCTRLEWYHTSYHLFSASLSHLYLFLHSSDTLFFSVYLHYSIHVTATNIRDKPWPHFLCGCSLLSSCQGATSATVHVQELRKIDKRNTKLIWNEKCRKTK